VPLVVVEGQNLLLGYQLAGIFQGIVSGQVKKMGTAVHRSYVGDYRSSERKIDNRIPWPYNFDDKSDGGAGYLSTI